MIKIKKLDERLQRGVSKKGKKLNLSKALYSQTKK